MKLIHKYIEKVEHELCGARKYAEEYILAKVMKNTTRAKNYWDMANDELRHASNLMTMYTEDMQKISEVSELTELDKEAWNECGRDYADAIGEIKKILE